MKKLPPVPLAVRVFKQSLQQLSLSGGKPLTMWKLRYVNCNVCFCKKSLCFTKLCNFRGHKSLFIKKHEHIICRKLIIYCCATAVWRGSEITFAYFIVRSHLPIFKGLPLLFPWSIKLIPKFFILVTAVGGRLKPEIYFLLGRLWWTLLAKRYGDSLSGLGSTT